MKAIIQLLIACQISLSASTSLALVRDASPQTAALIMKSGIGHKTQVEGKAVVSTGELTCTAQCAYQNTMLVDKIDCTTIDGAEKHFHIESSTPNASEEDRSFRAMLRLGMGKSEIPYRVTSEKPKSLLQSCDIHLNKIECQGPAENSTYDQFKCSVFTFEQGSMPTEKQKSKPTIR